MITRAELLVGFDKETERTRAQTLMDQFYLLPIDKAAADKAAELRRKYGWKLPDAFQPALAVNHGLALITRNTRDFNPREHSFVIIPYDLP